MNSAIMLIRSRVIWMASKNCYRVTTTALMPTPCSRYVAGSNKSSEKLTISFLLQLFADDPMSLNMGLPAQDKDLGNEMIAYNSSLFDLADDNNDSIEESAAALFPDSELNTDQPSMDVSFHSKLNTYFCQRSVPLEIKNVLPLRQ
jgi:hypothetical protein